MKTIIIAYACDPSKGSEEGVGYNYVLAISKFSKCLVITSSTNKAKLDNLKIKNVEWLYVEEDVVKKYLITLWSKIGSSLLRFVIAYSYSRWQKKVTKELKSILSKEKYDLIHKITYVGYRFPIYISNIPIINGPLGGIENMPINYFQFMSIKGKILFKLRNILNSFQRNFSLKLKNIYSKKNVHVISAHSNINNLIKKYFKKDSFILSEICYTNKNNQLVVKKEKKQVKVIWIGDIEPGKNLISLLKVKKEMQFKKILFDLVICGNGSEFKSLKEFARNNKIENVEFKGKISRDDTISLLEESDIYISTSLKDLTSTSLVEAMSCNCAIITTPLQGFKDAIGNAKSLYISLKSKEEFNSSLFKALFFLINNKTNRLEYAKSTLEESKKFKIDNVSKVLKNFYNQILNYQ